MAWLIQTPKALTPLQVDSARRVAAAAGLTIETKDSAPSLGQVRNDATVAGVLVALGVLAMTIGLIRSETAGDLRTLTATGASARTRRNITGATAGALGLLGALLGTVVAGNPANNVALTTNPFRSYSMQPTYWIRQTPLRTD